jgi:hypothetical protein
MRKHHNMKTTVVGNEVLLYSNARTDEPIRDEVCAVLPTKDWNGVALNLLNWKIDDGMVKLTYQTRFDLYAPVLETIVPLKHEEIPIQKPGRNYRWSSFGGYWQNSKTGEKRYVV